MTTEETAIETDTFELPERLDLRSENIAADRKEELLRLFPEVASEGGKVDFDQLRRSLGDAVDSGKERYGMSWPGKADCFKAIQTPSTGTLLPRSDQSVNFDATENLIIDGDNLEVLKLLQKSYLGKIKVIYIDPPYNTGNDFIYPDHYSESLQTYLEYTGQVDSQGKRFSTNTDTDGRFHSNWLNMMYPRLYLARNLLREDGVIFITIDDKEVDNLRKCCYEIFGEENFVTQIEWQKRYTRSNNTDDFTSVLDHVVVFSRSTQFRPHLNARDSGADARYQNPDDDSRGPWKAIPFLNPLSPQERPNLAYEIERPDGQKIQPTRKAWRSERRVWERLVEENRVWWGKSGNGEVPSIKRFLSEVRSGMTPINLWSFEFAGHTDAANQEIKDLFGDKIFDTPKPTKLIQRMLELATDDDEECIVLDFFAGSGSTAHAVLDANANDGGQRRFILVQLPELTGRDDFVTISDITKERVRRVISSLNSDTQGQLGVAGSIEQDRGFRAFELRQSNFTTWDSEGSDNAEALEEQLQLHIEHIRFGRTDDDLLYELLLKSGFPLTTSVRGLEMQGKTVFSVANGALLLCLDRNLTLDLIREIAEMGPERVIFLDAGFTGNDQLKANALQLFKSKGVTSFRTV